MKSLLRKIEILEIVYIFIIALILYFYDRDLSALAGGLFMLFNFHLLIKLFGNITSKSNIGWLFFKALLHFILFYGVLISLLLNPGIIEPIYFLIGSTTLFMSILTSVLIFMEQK